MADPVKEPVDTDSVKQTDPKNQWDANADTRGNPNAGHPVLDNADKLKDSGKDIGLVNAPIVSVNRTSGITLDKEKASDNIVKVGKPNFFLNHDKAKPEFLFPFDDTEAGTAFFIPLEAGQTTDALIAKLHSQIYQFVQQTSECEKDEKGDDVWESVVIQTRKRKDGVLELDSMGKPIVGANQTNRPKLIPSANFIVRAVVKGDDMGEGQEAETDGALVIRVF